jgi:regulator of sigma E protease
VPYKADTRGWRRKSVRQVLIYPAVTPLIEKVQPNTPAAAAKLQPGDVILGYNGTRIYHPVALADFIETHPDQPITLEVQRGGQTLQTQVIPKILDNEKKPRIGIQWDTSGKMTIAHPSPLEQIYNSVTSTLNTIGAVASPKSDVKLQHLSGPIGIGRIYYLLFENERGWQLALWFSVILNVNLAILNMLPIPVLDGGHIVLGIIESIRRRPLNTRVLEMVQGVCTALIIGVIIYTTFYDFQDLPFVKKKLDQYEPQSKQKDRDAP